jgi:uncharacterized membrane protein YheB (UPF0754 family)
MAGVEVLDPRKFMDNLKERVKTEFVNLVPPEQWENFILTEINRFKEVELKNLVKEELKKHVQEQVKQYLASKSEFQWNEETQRNELDKELLEGLSKLAPQMFVSIMNVVIKNFIEQMRYNPNFNGVIV